MKDILATLPPKSTPWKGEAYQDLIYQPDANWRPPTQVLSTAKTIALDMETRDPYLLTRGPGFKYGEGAPVGVAIATTEGSMYLPFAHLGGDNLDESIVKRITQKFLDESDEIFMANAGYDLGWLAAWGLNLERTNCIIRDVQVAEALLDEELPSYSLNSLSQRYLERPKDERILEAAARYFKFDPKADLWKMPARYVGDYAEIDALNTLEIGILQKPRLLEQGLWKVWELECAITKICYKMTLKGVPVDIAGAEKMNSKLLLREKELKKKFTFDIWSGPQIGYWIENTLNLAVPKTEKGNYSVTKEYLSASTNSMLQSLNELRSLERLRKVFIEDGVLKNNYRGKIHTTFRQVASDEGGTRSGRFAAQNPNLQQVPKRSEIGKLIRKLYIAEDDMLWAKADYSSQEPRLQVHYALILGLPGALDARQAFADGVKLYTFLEKLTGLDYDTCKMLVLGIGYGMGVDKMADTLNLGVDECKRVREQFKAKAPFIPMLFERCMLRADKNGHIRTIMGRKSRFEFWVRDREDTPIKGYDKAVKKHDSKNLQRAFLSRAMNRLIQGSAADQTKKAMVDCDAAGLDMRLTVHDEINSMVSDEKEANLQCEIMENTMQLKVPVKADLDLGKGWC